MSKPRERIRHLDTQYREPTYPRIEVTEDRVGPLPLRDMERWRAEMRVAVDYYIPEDSTAATREDMRRAAEDQLLVTLYRPLLEHVYALRSALTAGMVNDAQHIIRRIINEVTP